MLQKCSYFLNLVRHGETTANKQKLVQGQLDYPLSDVGIQQAENLGQSVKQETFDKVYSSDLKRAYETAELVLKHNKCSHSNIITDNRIREKTFGVLEGIPITEYVRLAKEANIPPHNYVPEGGESMQELRTRIKSFMQDLSASVVGEQSNCDKLSNVLVTTHGATIRDFLAYFSSECNIVCQDPTISLKKLCPNTGITRLLVSVNQHRKIRIDKVITIFNTDHLRGNVELVTEEKVGNSRI